MKKTAITLLLGLCSAISVAQQPQTPKTSTLYTVPLNAFTIYPNGVTSMLMLDMIHEGAQQVNVYNAAGKRMMSAVPGNRLCTMDISALASGTYFVFIDYRNGKKDAKRFVKS